jgi:hypothetical protein
MIKIQASDISHRHSGDTFRELLSLWVERGLCEVDIIKDKQYACWIGDVMLYDEPTFNDYNRQPYPFKFALFGNTVPKAENTSPWIFWGRRPRLMEEKRHELLSYDDRDIESMFLGKIENGVQNQKRTQHDWSNSVELFEMPYQGKYKYNQSEYLDLVKRSKYGLCLSGFGPKCNREIELLCMGTVPIITPLVDLTYYNKLEEDKHYIRVNSPDEIRDKIDSIGKEKWEEMSKNCLEWYEKNASVEGSFNITMEILEKNNLL